MLQTLRQPFPSQKNTKHTVRMCIMASICVWTVFYFIRPFGLHQLKDTDVAATGLKFALVTLVLSLFCTTVLPLVLPALFDEKHWTVLLEMIFLLSMVLLIALGNVWLTTYLFGNPLSARLVFTTIKYTLVIGAAPVLLSVLIKQQRLLSKYSLEARQIEESMAAPNLPLDETSNEGADTGSAPHKLTKQAPVQQPVAGADNTIAAPVLTAKDNPRLHLKGDNQAESLLLDAVDFLFAAAADNYTNIYYMKDGKVQQLLFRVSVKTLAEQVAPSASIFRCHKSYLVNLQQVAHISGNAQGYKLHLQQSGFTIPVSRSLNSQVKQLMPVLYPKK